MSLVDNGEMKAFTISDPAIILGLQDEIHRSEESRYDHRLHGLLLIAHGIKCSEVSRLLGDSVRTVQYWVRRFEKDGLAGLSEGEKTGRPRRLTDTQLAEIDKLLRKPPTEVGFSNHLWDGKTLSAFIHKRYRIKIGVRQCQRMFRRFGFRLRKPRPLIARADPEIQTAHKKNSDD